MTLTNRPGLLLLVLLALMALLTSGALRRLGAYEDATSRLGRLNAAHAVADSAWQDLEETLNEADREPTAADRARGASRRFAAATRTARLLSGTASVGAMIDATAEPALRSLAAMEAGVATDRADMARRAAAIRSERATLRGELQVALAEANASARSALRARNAWVAALLLSPALAAFCTWFLVHRPVRRRLREVSEFARTVSQEGFLYEGAEAPSGAGDGDLEVLAASVTHMGDSLTAQLASERDLRERLRKTERLAILGELAASVAHSLGNPTAAIRAAAELGASQAESSVDFDDILEAAMSLEVQISKILEAARPGEPDRRPVHLRDAVNSAWRLLQPLARRKGVRLEAELETEVEPVEADPAELERAFLAVLENALEASPADEPIRVTLAASDSDVVVSVEDRGPGVPPAERGRIFEHFYTTKPEGTGLGLSMARRVAENLGGSLTLEDAALGGAGVTFRIPRGRGGACAAAS